MSDIMYSTSARMSARMGQPACLVADIFSYCLSCCFTPVLENCSVEGMAWRERQVNYIKYQKSGLLVFCGLGVRRPFVGRNDDKTVR